MNRLWDFIAAVAVAVVLLLPKASVNAGPALSSSGASLDRRATTAGEDDAPGIADDEARVRDRISMLEAERFASRSKSPEQKINAAVNLGQAYLDVLHADWALATTADASLAGDPRIRLIRATARAERLEAAQAVEEGQRGIALCTGTSDACPPHLRIRITMITEAMQALVDAKIDPTRNPQAARDAVAKVLRTTKLPPSPPPKATSPSPPSGPTKK